MFFIASLHEKIVGYYDDAGLSALYRSLILHMLPAFVHHMVMNALKGATNLKHSVQGCSWNFNL